MDMAGVRGQEADAPDARHPLHRLQQPAQPGAAVRVPIGVDGLAEQGHLPHSLAGEEPHVLDHVLQRPAALDPAHEGDYAEAADLVAAEDDGHEGGQPLAQDRPAGRRGVGFVLALKVADEGLVFAHVEAVVEVRQPGEEAVLLLVRHAAGHGDRPPRPGSLPAAKLAEPAVCLLLRVLPHTAGHQYGEIGLVQLVGGFEAGSQQALPQVFGIGLVHLAAADPEMEAAAGGRTAAGEARRPPEVGRIEAQRRAGDAKAGRRRQVRHPAFPSGIRPAGESRSVPRRRSRCR